MGRYEWAQREKFRNLHKNVGGIRKWLICNRSGSSVSIDFDKSALPLIGLYFIVSNFEDPSVPEEEKVLEDKTSREEFEKLEETLREKVEQEREKNGKSTGYDSYWEACKEMCYEDQEKYSDSDDYSTDALNGDKI